jgi:hypothetical protein
MAYTKPEINDESDLKALLKAAQDAGKALVKIKPEDMTDEQLAELQTVTESISEIKAAQTAAAEAAAARVAAVESAKAALDAANTDPAEEEAPVEETPADEVTTETPADETPSEDTPSDEAPAETPTDEGAVLDVVIPDDASELIDEKETAVVASAGKGVAARVAAGQASAAPTRSAGSKGWNTGRATIKSAADVPGIPSGATLADFGSVAEAFSNRVGSFPQSAAPGTRGQHGVAIIEKEVDPQFAITDQMSAQAAFDAIVAAGDERRLEGESLVAAGGGWCSPSETVYNLPTLEQVSGILSMPEVTINRGGLSFTKGPDFATIYTDSGFLQTEAQAEAQTVKNFISVDCPPFQEVRLDAIGFGIDAGILTNAAWPELIRRYVDGVTVAHAHKVNAEKIKRILALITDTLAITDLGSTVLDTLDALELAALRLRYKYRLAPGQTLEGFAPVWLAAVLRADLAARTGVDMLAVSDQQINSYLAVRGVNLQWVYDTAQDLVGNESQYPATATVALYPAGTFVAGTSNVIRLDAIYDRPNLEVNTYTVMFMEEGLLVMNPVGSGTKVTIPTRQFYGRTGAANITSPAS